MTRPCRCHPSNRCGACDEPTVFDEWWMFCSSWISVAWAMTECAGYKRGGEAWERRIVRAAGLRMAA